MGTVSGIGVREIGRRWGTSGAYVSQFLKKSGLKPMPGGGYDFAEVTRLRQRFTVGGRGRKKWDRHHPSEQIHTCAQCGALYTPAGEVRDGFAARDISRFCVDACERDAVAGLTPEQTIKHLKASHLDNGGSRSDFRNPDKWLNYHTHYQKA